MVKEADLPEILCVATRTKQQTAAAAEVFCTLQMGIVMLDDVVC